MQLLEDKHIIDSGDMPERIAILRERVQKLLKNQDVTKPNDAHSKYNDELVAENLLLKKQLQEKPKGIDASEHEKLVSENSLLKTKLLESENNTNTNSTSSEILKDLETENAALRTEIEELNDTSTDSTNDELTQENIMLKKQLVNREKTIKELDFKLEMFKLAKSLREGAGISTKSEELKKIITEYIKEIDKSIASLNIE